MSDPLQRPVPVAVVGRRRARAVEDSRRLRIGGAAAALAGSVFLCTILYTFGFLASRGLTVEMLDDPARLLPWIGAHSTAYLGLWGIYLVSWLLLLPVPAALAVAAGRRGKEVGFANAAAFGGIVVGSAAVMVNASSAPVLVTAATAVEPATLPVVYLLSEVAGSFGLHLRLLADLLIGIWLATLGVALLQAGRWPALALAQIGVAPAAVVVTISKPLGWADWEPFLGLLLALVYLWLGFTLLRHAGSRQTQEGTRKTQT